MTRLLYTKKDLYKYAKDFCNSYEQAEIKANKFLDEEMTIYDLIDENKKDIFKDTIKNMEKIYEDVDDKMSSLQGIIVADFVQTLPNSLREQILLSCMNDILTVIINE